MLERSILGSKADADALVTTKDGALVVIFAAPDRAAVDGVIDGLTGSLPAAPTATGVHLRRRVTVGGWRMGVGLRPSGTVGGAVVLRPGPRGAATRRPGRRERARCSTPPTCWCSAS